MSETITFSDNIKQRLGFNCPPRARTALNHGKSTFPAQVFKVRTLPVLVLSLGCSLAGAAPIHWNTWASMSAGAIPITNGIVSVTYSGTVFDVGGYSSWLPASTYADGIIVDNAPVAANSTLELHGGDNTVNTVTFSLPVVDPVMAIFSLGQRGVRARFDFINVTPIFVVGGPNADVPPHFGGPGIAIVVNGNSVSGVEGNGTVQFKGTFESISWRNPVFEHSYGFNIGITGAVPEPQTYMLLLLGIGLVAIRARAQRHAVP